MIPHYPHNFIV